jgi:hypothetical protein
MIHTAIVQPSGLKLSNVRTSVSVYSLTAKLCQRATAILTVCKTNIPALKPP